MHACPSPACLAGDSPDRLGLVQGGLALHEADGCASAAAAAADGCSGSPPLWLTAVTRARVVYFVALSAPASTSSADGSHAADGLEATALPQHASAGLVPCAAVAPSRIGAADHDGDEGVLCACCPLPGVALLALSSGALAVCSAPRAVGSPADSFAIEGSTDPVLAMVAVPPAWVGSPAGAAAAVWALRASGELELWLLPAHGELVEWGRRAAPAHRARLVGPDGRPVVWAANASLQAALVADGGGAAGSRSASQAGPRVSHAVLVDAELSTGPGTPPRRCPPFQVCVEVEAGERGEALRFDVAPRTGDPSLPFWAPEGGAAVAQPSALLARECRRVVPQAIAPAGAAPGMAGVRMQVLMEGRLPPLRAALEAAAEGPSSFGGGADEDGDHGDLEGPETGGVGGGKPARGAGSAEAASAALSAGRSHAGGAGPPGLHHLGRVTSEYAPTSSAASSSHWRPLDPWAMLARSHTKSCRAGGGMLAVAADSATLALPLSQWAVARCVTDALVVGSAAADAAAAAAAAQRDMTSVSDAAAAAAAQLAGPEWTAAALPALAAAVGSLSRSAAAARQGAGSLNALALGAPSRDGREGAAPRANDLTAAASSVVAGPLAALLTAAAATPGAPHDAGNDDSAPSEALAVERAAGSGSLAECAAAVAAQEAAAAAELPPGGWPALLLWAMHTRLQADAAVAVVRPLRFPARRPAPPLVLRRSGLSAIVSGGSAGPLGSSCALPVASTSPAQVPAAQAPIATLWASLSPGVRAAARGAAAAGSRELLALARGDAAQRSAPRAAALLGAGDVDSRVEELSALLGDAGAAWAAAAASRRLLGGGAGTGRSAALANSRFLGSCSEEPETIDAEDVVLASAAARAAPASARGSPRELSVGEAGNAGACPAWLTATMGAAALLASADWFCAVALGMSVVAGSPAAALPGRQSAARGRAIATAASASALAAAASTAAALAAPEWSAMLALRGRGSVQTAGCGWPAVQRALAATDDTDAEARLGAGAEAGPGDAHPPPCLKPCVVAARRPRPVSDTAAGGARAAGDFGPTATEGDAHQQPSRGFGHAIAEALQAGTLDVAPVSVAASPVPAAHVPCSATPLQAAALALTGWMPAAGPAELSHVLVDGCVASSADVAAGEREEGLLPLASPLEALPGLAQLLMAAARPRAALAVLSATDASASESLARSEESGRQRMLAAGLAVASLAASADQLDGACLTEAAKLLLASAPRPDVLERTSSVAVPARRWNLLRRATHLLATAALLGSHANAANAAAEAASRGLACLDKARSLDRLASASMATQRPTQLEQQALARQAAVWRERLVQLHVSAGDFAAAHAAASRLLGAQARKAAVARVTEQAIRAGRLSTLMAVPLAQLDAAVADESVARLASGHAQRLDSPHDSLWLTLQRGRVALGVAHGNTRVAASASWDAARALVLRACHTAPEAARTIARATRPCDEREATPQGLLLLEPESIVRVLCPFLPALGLLRAAASSARAASQALRVTTPSSDAWLLVRPVALGTAGSALASSSEDGAPAALWPSRSSAGPGLVSPSAPACAASPPAALSTGSASAPSSASRGRPARPPASHASFPGKRPRSLSPPASATARQGIGQGLAETGNECGVAAPMGAEDLAAVATRLSALSKAVELAAAWLDRLDPALAAASATRKGAGAATLADWLEDPVALSSAALLLLGSNSNGAAEPEVEAPPCCKLALALPSTAVVGENASAATRRMWLAAAAAGTCGWLAAAAAGAAQPQPSGLPSRRAAVATPAWNVRGHASSPSMSSCWQLLRHALAAAERAPGGGGGVSASHSRAVAAAVAVSALCNGSPRAALPPWLLAEAAGSRSTSGEVSSLGRASLAGAPRIADCVRLLCAHGRAQEALCVAAAAMPPLMSEAALEAADSAAASGVLGPRGALLPAGASKAAADESDWVVAAPFAAAHVAVLTAVAALSSAGIGSVPSPELVDAVLDQASQGKAGQLATNSQLWAEAGAHLELRRVNGDLRGKAAGGSGPGASAPEASKASLALAAARLRLLVRQHVKRRVWLGAISEGERRARRWLALGKFDAHAHPRAQALAGPL